MIKLLVIGFACFIVYAVIKEVTFKYLIWKIKKNNSLNAIQKIVWVEKMGREHYEKRRD